MSSSAGPPYGSELVKVAWARNQAEAELIQGILEGEGIPSVVKRTRGFDVPDFLAAGPRDILVQQSAEQTARELLLSAEVLSEPQHTNGGGRGRGGVASPGRLLAWLLAATALAAALVWLLYQATG